MKIDFFHPRWGSEAIDWVDFAQHVKVEDFDGIAVFPLGDAARKENMVNILHDVGLDYIVLPAELTENGSDFSRYMDALERNLYPLISDQKNPIKPGYIVSQTGLEYFSMEQMGPCVALCDRMAQESGIPILQETHRSKWSDAAHMVNDYLESFPSLQLALDLSHWGCVSGSFLEDQQVLAIQHADHLLVKQGRWSATITPEFGPYPYMVYVPHSRSPVADQHEINLWMMRRLKQRFNQFTKGNNS